MSAEKNYFIEKKVRDKARHELIDIVSLYFSNYKLDLSDWFSKGKLKVIFTDKNEGEKTIVFFKDKDDDNWQTKLEKELEEEKKDYV